MVSGLFQSLLAKQGNKTNHGINTAVLPLVYTTYIWVLSGFAQSSAAEDVVSTGTLAHVKV